VAIDCLSWVAERHKAAGHTTGRAVILWELIFQNALLI